ncbi:MAG: DUF2784 domain-containing protein [Tepidisphaerales bacterium]
MLTAAAHLVMVAHFAFVAFVLLGGVIGVRWRNVLVWHVPIFAYAVVIQAVRFPCPLTLLEKDLRLLAGLPNYAGGFIGHYIEPYVAALGLPPVVYDHMGYWTVGFNAALYAGMAWRWRRNARGAPCGDAAAGRDGVPA